MSVGQLEPACAVLLPVLLSSLQIALPALFASLVKEYDPSPAADRLVSTRPSGWCYVEAPKDTSWKVGSLDTRFRNLLVLLGGVGRQVCERTSRWLRRKPQPAQERDVALTSQGVEVVTPMAVDFGFIPGVFRLLNRGTEWDEVFAGERIPGHHEWVVHNTTDFEGEQFGCAVVKLTEGGWRTPAMLRSQWPSWTSGRRE